MSAAPVAEWTAELEEELRLLKLEPDMIRMQELQQKALWCLGEESYADMQAKMTQEAFDLTHSIFHVGDEVTEKGCQEALWKDRVWKVTDKVSDALIFITYVNPHSKGSITRRINSEKMQLHARHGVRATRGETWWLRTHLQTGLNGSSSLHANPYHATQLKEPQHSIDLGEQRRAWSATAQFSGSP
jgi:hypothetical protein